MIYRGRRRIARGAPRGRCASVRNAPWPSDWERMPRIRPAREGGAKPRPEIRNLSRREASPRATPRAAALARGAHLSERDAGGGAGLTDGDGGMSGEGETAGWTRWGIGTRQVGPARQPDSEASARGSWGGGVEAARRQRQRREAHAACTRGGNGTVRAIGSSLE